ncbi:MAG: hypothetical protein R3234_10365 [Thermoanaerobaculia bacterium]|nr:hypothetical protein [Thermoanaerobaculia bacterium]
MPVPPDAPPSFFSGYSDILWRVDVQVRIPWWTDLEREFEVRVGI